MENLPWANKYSMKNISIPEEMEFRKKLVGQTENVIRRMSWKAFHYLNFEDEKQNEANSMFMIGENLCFLKKKKNQKHMVFVLKVNPHM